MNMDGAKASDWPRLVAELRAARENLSERGIAHLAVYGSRARGDARSDSDLDLLIELQPDARFSLIDLIKVEHDLADRLGIPVSAALRRGLSEGFRRSIASDIVEIF